MTGSIGKLSISLVSAALVTACTTTNPASTDNDAPSGDFTLRLAGDGGWDVRCNGQTTRGDVSNHERGRRTEQTATIAITDLIRLSCNYESNRSPLRVTLEETAFDCPFGTFSDGICRAEVPAGQTGTWIFEIDPAG